MDDGVRTEGLVSHMDLHQVRRRLGANPHGYLRAEGKSEVEIKRSGEKG